MSRRSDCTSVLGEADGQRAVGDLLLEQVLLVEEQDDGRLCEPFVVADGVKKLHALMHPVLGGTESKCRDKEITREHDLGHKGNELYENSNLPPRLNLSGNGLYCEAKQRSMISNSPSPHPQPGPDRKRSWPRRR